MQIREMKSSIEILNKLFGSVNRVKILRFFLSNPEENFVLKTVSERLNIAKRTVRKELIALHRVGFVKLTKKDKNEKWFLNHSFLFLKPLKNLILAVSPISKVGLLEKLKKIGRLKLVVLSGSLIQEDNDSKVDMLVVGDNLNRASVKKLLKNLETEVGKDISYVVMSVKEFHYRIDIRDKFVREIVESPHEIVLDKLKIL